MYQSFDFRYDFGVFRGSIHQNVLARNSLQIPREEFPVILTILQRKSLLGEDRTRVMPFALQGANEA